MCLICVHNKAHSSVPPAVFFTAIKFTGHVHVHAHVHVHMHNYMCMLHVHLVHVIRVPRSEPGLAVLAHVLVLLTSRASSVLRN